MTPYKLIRQIVKGRPLNVGVNTNFELEQTFAGGSIVPFYEPPLVVECNIEYEGYTIEFVADNKMWFPNDAYSLPHDPGVDIKLQKKIAQLAEDCYRLDEFYEITVNFDAYSFRVATTDIKVIAHEPEIS